MLSILTLMADAWVDRLWSLCVVGHVHVYLSYLIEIGLVLDDALDNVMVTHYKTCTAQRK